MYKVSIVTICCNITQLSFLIYLSGCTTLTSGLHIYSLLSWYRAISPISSMVYCSYTMIPMPSTQQEKLRLYTYWKSAMDYYVTEEKQNKEPNTHVLVPCHMQQRKAIISDTMDFNHFINIYDCFAGRKMIEIGHNGVALNCSIFEFHYQHPL